MFQTEKIQSLLPLGYLYLVILGIVKETIVFYQLGINIMKYSTLMDILLSPIAVITSHILIFSVFVLFLLYPLLVRYLFKNHSHKKWIRDSIGTKKNKEEMTPEEIEKHGNSLFFRTFMMFYFSIFLGIAFQEGHDTSQKIKNNTLKYNQVITFSTGESEAVSIIGSNSVYYFYVSKGNNKNIKILPISSIKMVELTNNKMLKK